MASSEIASQFQRLFDNAIAGNIVPGAQFVVFNKDKYLINGVSGYSKLPAKGEPKGVKMRLDDIHLIASTAKIAVSILALLILERRLAKNGMGLVDLDNHEKFAEIVPEFKRGSGSPVTKIIVGFKPELNEDGQRVPILKDVEGQVTLRMLLTHTAGFAYFVGFPIWFSSYIRDGVSKDICSSTIPLWLRWCVFFFLFSGSHVDAFQ